MPLFVCFHWELMLIFLCSPLTPKEKKTLPVFSCPICCSLTLSFSRHLPSSLFPFSFETQPAFSSNQRTMSKRTASNWLGETLSIEALMSVNHGCGSGRAFKGKPWGERTTGCTSSLKLASQKRTSDPLAITSWTQRSQLHNLLPYTANDFRWKRQEGES